MQQPIQVIYTGGTIGMEASDQGLVASGQFSQKFFESLPEYQNHPNLVLRFKEYETPIDSAQASLDLAVELFETISSLSSDCDRFLVLMGSDTLSFIASALAYLLHDRNLSVVITGSMKPLGMPDTDALKNLKQSLELLSEGQTGSIDVVFGGQRVPALHCAKRCASRDEAMIDTRDANHRLVQRTVVRAGIELPVWDKKQAEDLDIRVLRAAPSFSQVSAMSLVTGAPDAVIVECFGSGTVPHENSAFGWAVKRLVDDGIPVVAISQCFSTYLDFSAYASSDWIARLGVTPCGDMNFEATYTKLWYLLNLGFRGHQLNTLMAKNICGELRL